VDALPKGGWLALAVPVAGSFPQWQHAARAANQTCTALSMPVREQLMAALPDGVVQRDECLSFTQRAANPLRLLRPMSNIGASVTNGGQLSPGQWKAVFRAWPQADASAGFALTWRMWVLMVKR
jgi:malonyl-CoA O-methyltransferase